MLPFITIGYAIHATTYSIYPIVSSGTLALALSFASPFTHGVFLSKVLLILLSLSSLFIPPILSVFIGQEQSQ